MTAVDFEQPGVWQALFVPALALMDHLEARTGKATWTFGGGTVLMLRIAHRMSKDIDLFVPDPQYLGYVNPRLSDTAANISGDYDESAEHIKLHLAAGEIDVVAGPNLTEQPCEVVPYRGRNVLVEEADPRALEMARPFFERHGARFIATLHGRSDIAMMEYDAIDAIGKKRNFARDLELARSIIDPPSG